jgi:hypothetical protein
LQVAAAGFTTLTGSFSWTASSGCAVWVQRQLDQLVVAVFADHAVPGTVPLAAIWNSFINTSALT